MCFLSTLLPFTARTSPTPTRAPQRKVSLPCFQNHIETATEGQLEYSQISGLLLPWGHWKSSLLLAVPVSVRVVNS